MSRTGADRKPSVPEDELINLFIQMKSQLFINAKLVSKTNDVWESMVQELGGKLSAGT